MKKYFYTPVLVLLLTAFVTVRAQDRQEYLGLPGDNLNLFAVMKLFQESETLEAFERDLNDQNSLINNLDLDGNGYVDYIRVIDNVDRNVHYIVLQVAINPRENQDVAVFTVIRETNGQIDLQLVGDEALYGRNYVIEPIVNETPNPGYMGNAQRATFRISAWPIVHFIFMPTYVVWHSPWYYNYYPSYWHSWNPFYWHYYYGYHYNYYSYYYGHYRHWDQPHYSHWHDSYYSHYHHSSPYVRSRINDGYYKKTYSRPEQRSEGAAMYYRSRDVNGTRTNVSSSGGKRQASGSGTARGTGTSSGNRSTTYGPRESTSTNRESTSGTRQSTTTGTRQPAPSGTRQSTSSGTRTSTSTQARPSTSTGNRETTTKSTRQSTAPAATKAPSSGTRQSSGSDRRSTESNRSGSTSKSADTPESTKSTHSTGRR